MPDVIRFDSTEEMVEFFAKARAEREERAKNLAPAQERLTVGDYAVRFLPELTIFVEIEDLRDISVGGTHYSVLVPDGEYGSTDKAILWPIDAEVFKVAKAFFFNPDRLPPWERLAMDAAFNDLREHLGS